MLQGGDQRGKNYNSCHSTYKHHDFYCSKDNEFQMVSVFLDSGYDVHSIFTAIC